jgi:chromosome segregation ATPase
MTIKEMQDALDAIERNGVLEKGKEESKNALNELTNEYYSLLKSALPGENINPQYLAGNQSARNDLLRKLEENNSELENNIKRIKERISNYNKELEEATAGADKSKQLEEEKRSSKNILEEMVEKFSGIFKSVFPGKNYRLSTDNNRERSEALGDLQKKNSELEKDIKNKKIAISDLNKEIEQAAADADKNTQLIKEAESLKETAIKLQAQLAADKARVGELKKQLDSTVLSSGYPAREVGNIKDLKEKNSKLEAQNAETQTKINNIENDIAVTPGLIAKSKDLQAAKVANDKVLSDLSDQFDSISGGKSVDAINKEIKKLEEENAKFDAEKAAVEAKLSELQKSLDKLGGLKEVQEQNQTELDQLRKDEVLHHKTDSMEKMIVGFKDYIKLNKAKYKDLIVENNKLEKALAAKDQELERARAFIKGINEAQQKIKAGIGSTGVNEFKNTFATGLKEVTK